jgi:ribosomal protein L10
MKVPGGAIAVVLALVGAAPLAAQQAPAARGGAVATEIEQIVERSGVIPALEALAAAVAPELERTAEQLTNTLNLLAHRIARDPELRTAAVRAAQGTVDVAETVVVEQAGSLQQALRLLAERLDAAAAAIARERGH